MAIDPTFSGLPASARIPLPVAGQLARNSRPALMRPPSDLMPPGSTPAHSASSSNATRSERARNVDPHTPIRASSTGDRDRWDGMLNRLGTKHNVPPLFLKAVMLAESSGNPNAIGDNGHSVGLFQLHDRGYGHGMGDARFDPEVNAERAASGLGKSWRHVERAGYSGEHAVRAAYDHTFNPGGGFAYQGDKIVQIYNGLLEEQGLSPLA